MCLKGLSGSEPCSARAALGAAQGSGAGTLGWKDGRLLWTGTGRAQPLAGMAGARSLCLS